MKKIIIFVAILALVLLGACSFSSGGDDKGSVSMRFALAPLASKGLVGTEDTARIWIYSNNVLLEKDKTTEYYQVALTSGAGSITIEELPPGNDYRLVVASGEIINEKTTAADYFNVVRYGMSTAFEIKAGTDTSVAMTLEAITTAYKALASVKSLVTVSGKIIAASSAAIHSGSSISGLTTTDWSSSYGTINSLSLGYTSSVSSYYPLVNTTNGVYTLAEEGPPIIKADAITSVLKDGKPESQLGALQSGAYDDVYFYQGERQFGGLTGTDTVWTKIKLDIAGLSGKPIIDFFVVGSPSDKTNVFAFFATRFVGTFRMGESFIDQGADFDYLEAILGKNSLLSFFGEDLPLIQAFGYTGDTGNTLYLGTKSGVYKTTAAFTSTSGALGTTPVLVTGTKGINVTKIVTRLESDVPVAAMLSSDEIIVVKGSLVYRMPYLKWMAGTLSDIAWNGTKVVVTGSLGVAEIETSALK